MLKKFFLREYNLEMNFQDYNRQKQRLIAIKVELKDKEGIRKVNQIEENHLLNLLLFCRKDSKNKLNFGFSANINKASKRHFDLVNGIKGAKKKILLL
jgi:hypothetical protein